MSTEPHHQQCACEASHRTAAIQSTTKVHTSLRQPRHGPALAESPEGVPCGGQNVTELMSRADFENGQCWGSCLDLMRRQPCSRNPANAMRKTSLETQGKVRISDNDRVLSMRDRKAPAILSLVVHTTHLPHLK